MTVLDHPEHVMGGEIYYRKDKYAHNPELLDAYECGKADGWRCAMEEARRSGGYNERRDWREMPPMMREHDRYLGGHPDYREDGYEDGYGERRHRNSMGRFSRY